jgi:FKBP-type peptidyl-prolyl cis-trans isomerase
VHHQSVNLNQNRIHVQSINYKKFGQMDRQKLYHSQTHSFSDKKSIQYQAMKKRRNRKKDTERDVSKRNDNASNIPQSKPLSERRLPSGVTFQDWCLGTGRAIQLGRIVTLRLDEIWQNGNSIDLSTTGKGDNNSQSPLTSTWSFRYGTGQVIRGLDEGLEGMRTGGQRRVTIPPERAYGAEGNGATIPPNAIVTMLVTLVSVGR